MQSIEQSQLLSQLRALSEGTTEVYSFTTPGLPCLDHQRRASGSSCSFNNHENLDFFLGQPPLALSLDHYSLRSTFPLDLSILEDLVEPSSLLTSMDRSSELCCELLEQPSTNSIHLETPLEGPFEGCVVHPQRSMTVTDWIEFIERLSSTEAGCDSVPSASASSDHQIRTEWFSLRPDDASSSSSSSKDQLSQATCNMNRRAKRKAKVGELYSTGTMKRQAEAKPYDKLVKKFRLKL